jgi:hypothetical protein
VANRAASARVEEPILWYTLPMWALTVRGLMNSSLATSALVMPRATSTRTSTSRALRFAG